MGNQHFGATMLTEPKTIFLQTELEWPPIDELSVSKASVRSLYNKMFEPGGYPYDNLDLQKDKPTLHRKSGSGHSVCQFGPTSITIEEKESEHCLIEQFIEVIETVLGGMEEHEIPPFIVQRVRIQCLVQPSNCNAVELLAGRASDVYSKIEPFNRPPSDFGIRFRFLPIRMKSLPSPEEGESESETREPEESHHEIDHAPDLGYVTLRMESYSRNRQQVWMEVAAMYPQVEAPMALADVKKIASNVRSSYEFLTENCVGFLNQFDKEVSEGESDE